jgi:carbonic anhydrase
MQDLITGIHQFASEIFSPRKEFFEHLALGQRPETLFVTCSDARVDPQLITQADPGNLFMLRNIGNIIPPHQIGEKGTGAAIEYAVSALGVKHIVVCGHSHCGAMTALIHPEKLQNLPAVSEWLAPAETTWHVINENYGRFSSEKRLSIAIEKSVLAQLENLRTHPSVAAGLSSGQLTVQGWVYKIETGEVFIYHPDRAKFLACSNIQQIVAFAEGQAETVWLKGASTADGSSCSMC